ncbi:MAG: hypothetical protein MUE69_32270, partial [Myxococcota bacterium]|nr:hypothetical protein [Myxococcota bacterium]
MAPGESDAEVGAFGVPLAASFPTSFTVSLGAIGSAIGRGSALDRGGDDDRDAEDHRADHDAERGVL